MRVDVTENGIQRNNNCNIMNKISNVYILFFDLNREVNKNLVFLP